MRHCVKKALCILLVLCFVSISAFAANGNFGAAKNVVQPRFTYIGYASVGLGIEHDGYATCDTDVTLYESIYDVEIIMTLQRNDGSGWEDVRSWTIIDDGPNADIIKHWYVVSGYDYQVMSDIFIYNQNNVIIELTTEFSPIVEY